ncbi:MAG: hypothetical protein Q9160_005244 [Pyrenula sp. 1 TL-2023]
MHSPRKRMQEKKEIYRARHCMDDDKETNNVNGDLQNEEVVAPIEADCIIQLRFNPHRDARRDGAGRAPNKRAGSGNRLVSPLDRSLAASPICEQAERQHQDAERSETSKIFDTILRAGRGDAMPGTFGVSASNSLGKKRKYPSSPVVEPIAKKRRTSSVKPATKKEGSVLSPSSAIGTSVGHKRKASVADLEDLPSLQKAAKRQHEHTPNPRKRKASVSVDVGSAFYPRKRRMLEHDAAPSPPSKFEPVAEPENDAVFGKKQSMAKAWTDTSRTQQKSQDDDTDAESTRMPRVDKQDPVLPAEGMIHMREKDTGIRAETDTKSEQDNRAHVDNKDSTEAAKSFRETISIEAGLDLSQLGANDIDPEMQAALLTTSSLHSETVVEDSAPGKPDLNTDSVPGAFQTSYGTSSSAEIEQPLPHSWLPRGLENPRFACYQNAVLQCLHALPKVRGLLSDIDDQPTERALDNNLSEEEIHLCSWSHKLKRTSKATRKLIKSCKSDLKRHLQTREDDGKLCLSRHLANLFAEMSEDEGEPIDKWLLQHVCGEVLDKPDFSPNDSFDGESQEDAAAFLRQLILRLDSEIGQGSIARLFDTETTCRRSCKKCNEQKSFHQDTERWERARAVDPSRYLVVNISRDGNQQVQPTLSDIAVPATKDGRHFTARYALQAVTVFIAAHGARDGGHYMALRKHGDRWFCCNDDTVSELSGTELLRKMNLGRVFFYERVDDK